MEETTPPFVKITNREIYDGLQSVQRDVTGIRADMSVILKENVELRRRVRSLELKVYTVLAGVVSAGVAGLFAVARF